MPIPLEPPIRRARPSDAGVLAELVNDAGEGMPLHLWTRMAAPGEDPWSLGRARQLAKIETDEIFVVDRGDGPIAGLTGYAIPAQPPPIPADMPAMFRPMQELENLAPATWYVNVLATLPGHRGQGWGTRLLTLAEHVAAESGLRGLSIIVADNNAQAHRLYQRHGYRELARRAMVKEGWETEGTAFVLLTRPA